MSIPCDKTFCRYQVQGHQSRSNIKVTVFQKNGRRRSLVFHKYSLLLMFSETKPAEPTPTPEPTKPAAPTTPAPINRKSYQPRLGLARAHRAANEIEDSKKYYNEVIAMAPEVGL